MCKYATVSVCVIRQRGLLHRLCRSRLLHHALLSRCLFTQVIKGASVTDFDTVILTMMISKIVTTQLAACSSSSRGTMGCPVACFSRHYISMFPRVFNLKIPLRTTLIMNRFILFPSHYHMVSYVGSGQPGKFIVSVLYVICSRICHEERVFY